MAIVRAQTEELPLLSCLSCGVWDSLKRNLHSCLLVTLWCLNPVSVASSVILECHPGSSFSLNEMDCLSSAELNMLGTMQGRLWGLQGEWQMDRLSTGLLKRAMATTISASSPFSWISGKPVCLRRAMMKMANSKRTLAWSAHGSATDRVPY